MVSKPSFSAMNRFSKWTGDNSPSDKRTLIAAKIP
jgi:hypothetical protein